MFQQGRLRQLISLPDSLVPSLRLCFGPARLSLNKWLLSHLSALILSIPIPQIRLYCVFAIPSYAPGPPLSPIFKFNNQVVFILCPNLVLIKKDNGYGNGKPDSTVTTPALQPNPMLALLFCGGGCGIRIILGGNDIREGAEVAFIANWRRSENLLTKRCVLRTWEGTGAPEPSFCFSGMAGVNGSAPLWHDLSGGSQSLKERSIDEGEVEAI